MSPVNLELFPPPEIVIFSTRDFITLLYTDTNKMNHL